MAGICGLVSWTRDSQSTELSVSKHFWLVDTWLCVGPTLSVELRLLWPYDDPPLCTNPKEAHRLQFRDQRTRTCTRPCGSYEPTYPIRFKIVMRMPRLIDFVINNLVASDESRNLSREFIATPAAATLGRFDSVGPGDESVK